QGELDVTGSLSFERELAPGFYVVRLRSLPGAPRGNFQMALEAPGGSFNGGVVVGGFLDRRSDGTSRNGFGAFCLPSSQAVRFKSFGRAEYGPVGAESIIVSMLDNDRNLIDSFDTSLLSSVDVSLPEPPEMPPSVSWYVDDDAAPGGSGSASHPFRSITDAINSAAPGQTILVRPGTYGPSTTGETLPIGTRGPGLTGFDENVQLIGSGAETTIIDAELQPGIAVVLNADGVRLAGFTVKRAGSVGVYVFRSDGVTVENNHFTGNQRFGAGGELSSALIVRNNNAVGNVESGFAFSGSVPTVPRAEAAGVCPDSPTGNEYGAWIHDNNSSNNRAVGILLTQGGNYCVADNVLVNNGSSGVELNNRDQENVGRPPLNGVVIRNRIETNGGQQFSYAGTGILATENGATIDLIEDNRLIRNRPYGIGVFLEGRVGTIRNNQVLSSVSNAVLVRLDSEVDDIVDNIITGSGDSGILIANEGWVGRTSNNLIARNNKGLSVLSNSRLVTSEFDRIEDNARIGLEIVDANLDESTGCDILRNGIESAESGNGIQIRGSATALIRACRVDDNFGQGGVYAGEGAKIVFDGVEFHGNRRRGVLATDDGTTVEINDSFISGTLRLDGANADYGYGVSSRLGARIDCSETVIQSNEGGSVFAVSGTAEGCN
ncbi:MAG: right-handed parallel beta-helix repeat-containing protein, partial [Wenzhouxiangella sp.]|nr:right-handed parallel beta-helix repeat-containing protein [Wenzhouxiangella sp.]